MKKPTLTIQKRYLVFRDEAKNLLKTIKKKATQEKAKILYLDFSKVEFFSRSFIDELLNVINDLKNEKIMIRVVNLKPQLEHFLWKVNERKEKIKKEISG